ncbi:AHH domain-containing protein [Bradyrhizobium sp. CCBAU 11357]|uniref:AHH domain-containing protein n=1 Tax=Bradyrhizobium sp. CCBAU 11357 TaxID=1630808 RepID=UPI002304566A|nr:AHH domain-containing protein [Bradyrhizobium sp. CCBAU 11357]
MSILAYHHMISQKFDGHRAFDGIDRQTLGVYSRANGIYLPVDYQLAASMGISPHPGGHTPLYYGAVKCVLDRIAEIPQPEIRAVKIRTLMDAMRIGFAKGDLYTNLPTGKTLEDVKQGIENVIKKNESYLERYPDLHQRLRDSERSDLQAGEDHLLLWSAIRGDARREKLLSEAIERNPNVSITSGNKHLGGTGYSKFTPVDDVFQIPPTTAADPADIPSPPPFVPPSVQWLNESEGFARSDPRFTSGPPPSSAPDPNEQTLGRLPPTTAAPSAPLVLLSDPHSGMPDPYYENPLAGGTPVMRNAALPWLAGGVAAAVAAPFLPGWLAALGAILAGTRLANAEESSSGATMEAATPSGGVFSTGAPAFNANGDRLYVGRTRPQPGEASSFDREASAGTFADRFGEWATTPVGTMPAKDLPVAPTSAAGSVAPEDVRRLARVNETNAGNVFTSGSAPVPYLPSTEFDERFGSWTAPAAGGQQPQPSKPIGVFADEPSYLIPPPIFGVNGPVNPHNDSEEWFSRWIRPLLPPE